MMVVINEVSSYDVDMYAAFEDYNLDSATDALRLEHLSRRTIAETVKKFYRESQHSEEIWHVIQQCPGPPAMYRVVHNNTHWFRGRSVADWLWDDIEIGEDLLLYGYDDEWLAEICDEAETQRYIPRSYMGKGNLRKTQDLSETVWSIQTQTSVMTQLSKEES